MKKNRAKFFVLYHTNDKLFFAPHFFVGSKELSAYMDNVNGLYALQVHYLCPMEVNSALVSKVDFHFHYVFHTQSS